MKAHDWRNSKYLEFKPIAVQPQPRPSAPDPLGLATPRHAT